MPQAQGAVQAAPAFATPIATPPIANIVASAADVTAMAVAGTPAPKGTFLINPTTFMLYGQSDGVGGYQGFGGAVNIDGDEYLPLSDGSLMPLAPVVGTPVAPLIAGAYQTRLTMRADTDINHPTIAFTIDATTGDPQVPSEDLAEARFLALADLEDHGINGLAAGATFNHTQPCTVLHFAFLGAGSYTTESSNMVGQGKMGLVRFPTEIAGFEVSFAPSDDDGGTNKRQREITIRGFALL